MTPNMDEGYQDGLHGRNNRECSPNYCEGWEAGWRYAKRPGAERERLAAAARRVEAAESYLNGKATLEALAKEHGMAVGTIRDWVQARNRETLHARDPARAERKKNARKDLEHSTLEHGPGGRMCDVEIRTVTRALEVSIVALQAKLGLRTLTYRGRI